MMELSIEDLKLLEACGISISDLTKAINQKEKVKKEPTIDLSLRSTRLVKHCACCGKDTITYCDYVKRVDEPGYALHTVCEPSHRIDRDTSCTVFSCEYCEVDMLMSDCVNQTDMIEMIENLRNYIRKGIKL